MPQADLDLPGAQFRRKVHLFRIEGFRIGDVGPEHRSEVGKVSGRQKTNGVRSHGPLHHNQRRGGLDRLAVSGQLLFF